MYERGLIYVLADPRDGRIRYCGKTVKEPRQRLKDHLWTRSKATHRPLYAWLDELLKLSLFAQIVVVEEVDFGGLGRKEQIAAHDEAERRWIANLRGGGADLLNCTSGGNGAHGRKASAEAIEKARQANLGRKRTKETCGKLSAAAKARGEQHYAPGMRSLGWGDPSRVDQVAKAKKIRDAWARKPEAERIAHGARHLGEKNPRATTTVDVARAVFGAQGSQRQIALDYDISFKVVNDIKRRRSWRHATGTMEVRNGN